ncbi:unnamed protein product [Coregonus sp. 'balchen']|nr:unnamed protein product [Coregonus sp. 'balchen']
MDSIYLFLLLQCMCHRLPPLVLMLAPLHSQNDHIRYLPKDSGALAEGVADEVTLVEAVEDKLHGEVLDMQHASLFLKTSKITAARAEWVPSGEGQRNQSGLSTVPLPDGERLQIHPSIVHRHIIGEHGDSSVAVWSGATAAGVHLESITRELEAGQDSEGWADVHQAVIDSAYEVIRLKGHNSWVIGPSVSSSTGYTEEPPHHSPCVHPRQGHVWDRGGVLRETEVQGLQASAWILGQTNSELSL